MTTLVFVRHGVTAWNKEGRAQGSTDVPLDDEGIEMAERVADRFNKEEWDIIYTSPLIRAKKTAEIIADRKPEVNLLMDERLSEIGGGLVEGTTEAERVEKWGASWRDLELGFEPYKDIISRGMEFVEEIKETHPGKRVLVVSHGGFIGRMVEVLVPDDKLGRDLDNTSVTIIELDEENRCHLFNCTEHLTKVLNEK